MVPVVEAVAGGDESRVFLLKSGNGDVVTTYTEAAELLAEVWTGDDQETLFEPTVEWESVDEGKVRITFASADTETLAEGDYPVMLSITASGLTAKRRIALLRVSLAPGTAEPRPVYCTYGDMLRYAGGLAADLGDISDQTGFADERADARSEIDETLMSRVEWQLTNRVQRADPFHAWDFTRTWNPTLDSDGGNTSELEDFRDYLSDGKLRTDARLKEIAARLSVALVYDRQSASGAAVIAGRGNEFKATAAEFRRRALMMLYGWVGWIDADEDGVYEYKLTA
jgi:hypothetical protein